MFNSLLSVDVSLLKVGAQQRPADHGGEDGERGRDDVLTALDVEHAENEGGDSAGSQKGQGEQEAHSGGFLRAVLNERFKGDGALREIAHREHELRRDAVIGHLRDAPRGYAKRLGERLGSAALRFKPRFQIHGLEFRSA